MAEPKPQLEPDKGLDKSANDAAERAANYQRSLSDIMEEAGSLDALVREHQYEKIPGDEAIDPVLQKLEELRMVLPEEHPLRQQHAIQEKAAREMVENVKNAKAYLKALETAEKDIKELSYTLQSKESLSEMLEGDTADVAKEQGANPRHVTEDALSAEYDKIMGPIFNTLPETHTLRKKHAEEEQRLRQIFEEAMKRSAEGKTAPRPSRDLEKTVPHVDIPEEPKYKSAPVPPPPPPPAKPFNPAEELVPDEMKAHMTPPAPKEEKSTEIAEFERRLSDLYQHVLSLEAQFKKASNQRDTPRLEELLAELLADTQAYAELENQFGKPTLDEEGEFLRRKLLVRFGDLQRYGNQASGVSISRSNSLPRVPAPPYRRMGKGPLRKMATLAVAPVSASLPDVNVQARPLPPVPENIASGSEDEKLAYLEELLTAFKAEHTRLVDEHNDLVKRLTEQVKERKLQALRESLKP